MEKSNIWIFGNNVDTDQILPSQYLLLASVEDMKHYTFETLIPDFAKKIQKGDVIIAGENFGCGSSREQAPRVLKALGVKAVIAASFARIFFRNAINIGLPVIISKDARNAVNPGDQILLDLEMGIIKTKDRELSCTKLPEYMQNILNAGGLLELLNKEVVK
ncbi:Isopropylmalate/citramalate isomerase small subunit [Bacillota bacterium]